jgi:hypothetical protein
LEKKKYNSGGNPRQDSRTRTGQVLPTPDSTKLTYVNQIGINVTTLTPWRTQFFAQNFIFFEIKIIVVGETLIKRNQSFLKFKGEVKNSIYYN